MTERLTETYPCDLCNVEFCYRQCYKMTLWAEKAKEKLAEYEIAEDEGRLVVLPYRAGDAVYVIEDKYYEYLYHKGIQKGHVCRFEYDKEWFAWIHIDGCNKDLQIAYKTSNFNQTVFLTRGEAEKALKEMEKDDAAN